MKTVTTTASGNGASDDTAALQADLNLLAQSTVPTRLWLPRGIYRIRRPLRFIAPSVATAIDGDFSVITPGMPGTPSVGSLAALLRLVVPSGSGPFELRRLTLNGSGQPKIKYITTAGLELYGGSNKSIVIESVLAYLCQVGFAISGCDGFVVRYCRATACESVGWAIGGGTWTSPIKLDSCSATDGLLHGLWCAPGAQATLSGFHAETNAGRGVVLGSEAVVFSGAVEASAPPAGPPVDITGGLFEANYKGGIAVFGGTSAKISWPRFVGGGGGILTIEAKSGGTVDVTLPFISSSPDPVPWNWVPLTWEPQWTT
jgi:hypothetical protein